MKYDFFSFDVVAEAPPAKPEPVLTFPSLHAFKFPDVINPAAVIRIGFKNPYGLSVMLGKLRVAFDKRLKQAVKV
ncbi:MAG TPA: hypothetical protein VLB01_08175 [Thermodesulfobacteriota bacterium]|nr:hypothetical protein [Thermodesulfobacteriota bacterium]